MIKSSQMRNGCCRVRASDVPHELRPANDNGWSALEATAKDRSTGAASSGAGLLVVRSAAVTSAIVTAAASTVGAPSILENDRAVVAPHADRHDSPVTKGRHSVEAAHPARESDEAPFAAIPVLDDWPIGGASHRPDILGRDGRNPRQEAAAGQVRVRAGMTLQVVPSQCSIA